MADEVTRRAARLAALIALPVALIAGLLAFWGLGGFHSATTPAPRGTGTPAAAASAPPVAMPARSLADREATMCLAFIAHLPPTVRGLAQRPVTAGPEQNAAYGNPAITVGCGGWVLPPDTADKPLWTLSGGLCWYADESRPEATVWTTLDRQAPIRITLPASYRPALPWVQEFSAPILQWVPSLPHPPAQCRAPSTAPS